MKNPPNITFTTTASQDGMALLGRVLIALLFVPAGFAKIGGFAGTAGYIASKGLPLPELGAVIAIAVELGLGLMLLVGWRTRFSALVLALFTVATSIFFHNFWGVPAEQVMMQKMNFFKNLAIAGGLFAFASFGAGAWSLDGRTRR
ncbi:MAG TPA: DoxX family protein [Ramlibacter sp.]|nr:DoxX family protein [Ramlibacter sp.]